MKRSATIVPARSITRRRVTSHIEHSHPANATTVTANSNHLVLR